MPKQKGINPEELKPVLEDHSNIDFTVDDKEEIKETLTQNIFTSMNVSENSADSFFKNVIDKLFSGTDIELKTEYTNIEEVFTGSTLDYMNDFGGFNNLSPFVTKREKKMVSLGRKSRQEVVLGLQKREEEIRKQEKEEYDRRFST